MKVFESGAYDKSGIFLIYALNIFKLGGENYFENIGGGTDGGCF